MAVKGERKEPLHTIIGAPIISYVMLLVNLSHNCKESHTHDYKSAENLLHPSQISVQGGLRGKVPGGFRGMSLGVVGGGPWGPTFRL